MLKFNNITAAIGKQTILHDIDVSFPYGTITTILGPNGCGKSTMLRCLINPKMITSGSITLDDFPLFEYPPLNKAKRIAILPQLRETPSMTVRSLVTQGRYPYSGLLHRKSLHDMRLIMRAMQETNTLAFSEKDLLELSGGERQRAYLAMILAQNTDYIILDEPTTFLDIKHRLEFLDLLSYLRDRGKTIIVILHDINEALQIADIMLLMKEGQIVRTLTREEFLNSEVMDEVFQVHFQYKEENDRMYTSFHL